MASIMILFFYSACLLSLLVDGLDIMPCNVLSSSKNVLPPSLSSSSSSSSTAHNRRSMIKSTVSSLIIGGGGVFGMNPNIAMATEDEMMASNNNSKKTENEYTIHPLTVSIPTSWKVTLNNNSINSQNQKNGPKLFSAIDFQSGSVITIVKERACDISEYAKSSQTCDLVLTSSSAAAAADRIYSSNTINKDIIKLLIRHDDRDNLVLQGTTRLDSYDTNNNKNGSNDSPIIVDIAATTTIPTGGTYRDTMGLDQPNTIDRKVKAKSVTLPSSDDENSKYVLTLWLTAPLDEWQKPVMGTKLNQVWQSIRYSPTVTTSL